MVINKKRNGKRVLGIIMIVVVVLLLIGFFYSICSPIYYKRAIKKDMKIVQGARIYNTGKIPKTYRMYGLKFVFNYNGVIYKGETRNSYKLKRRIDNIDRAFPVAFQGSDISNAFILIKPEDFEYFEIPYPDSLDWVKEELLAH